MTALNPEKPEFPTLPDFQIVGFPPLPKLPPQFDHLEELSKGLSEIIDELELDKVLERVKQVAT